MHIVHRHKTIAAWIIMLLWLSASAAAFYYFELRAYQSFDTGASPSPELLTELRLLQAEEQKKNVLVVHFLDTACDCFVYARAHLSALTSSEPFLKARHVLVGAGDSTLAESALAGLSAARMTASEQPMSPAVAVLDRHGELSYYGPYSSGPACGPSGDRVLPVLDALAEGKPLPIIQSQARSCSCSRA